MGQWLSRKFLLVAQRMRMHDNYELKDLFRGSTGATLSGALTWMEQIFDTSVGHDFR